MKKIEKITPFDVFAQKNIAYSDVLEHFQQKVDLSAIFNCWTLEFGNLGFVIEL